MCCGYFNAIAVLTAAPKSPPCAPNFSYPSSFIKPYHNSAIKRLLHPVVFGFCEKPNPGIEGMTRSNENSASVVRRGTIFIISKKEPGQPCVMISGKDFLPCPLTYKK